jgi:hypothetical protein
MKTKKVKQTESNFINIPIRNTGDSNNSAVIISLTNLTSDKLDNVDLINPDFEKQDKIDYAISGGLTYQQFLLQLADKSYKIGRVRNISLSEQSTNNAIYVENLGVSNSATYKKIELSPINGESTVIDREIDGTFLLSDKSKLALDFILPNATVTFVFYVYRAIEISKRTNELDYIAYAKDFKKWGGKADKDKKNHAKSERVYKNTDSCDIDNRRKASDDKNKLYKNYLSSRSDWTEIRPLIDKPFLQNVYYNIGDEITFVQKNTYALSENDNTQALLIDKRMKYKTHGKHQKGTTLFYGNILCTGIVFSTKTSDDGSAEIIHKVVKLNPPMPNCYVYEKDVITNIPIIHYDFKDIRYEILIESEPQTGGLSEHDYFSHSKGDNIPIEFCGDLEYCKKRALELSKQYPFVDLWDIEVLDSYVNGIQIIENGNPIELKTETEIEIEQIKETQIISD